MRTKTRLKMTQTNPNNQTLKYRDHHIRPFSKNQLNFYDPIVSKYRLSVKAPSFLLSSTTPNSLRLAKQWYNNKIPNIPDSDINNLRTRYLEFNPYIQQEDFDRTWNQFAPRLKNPALYQYLKKSFIFSKFVIPWMIRSPRPSSWEFGFGYGYDFSGFWSTIMDEFFSRTIVFHNPTFKWYRECAILTANTIKHDKHTLFLNAGCLPELRHIQGFNRPKHIFACDENPTVDTSNIFGWSTSEHGINYISLSPLSMLDNVNSESMKFDSIILRNATVQYYPDFPRIIKSAISALKPNGKILIDIITEHPDIIRAATVFGIWPNAISIPPTINDALDNIASICDSIYGIKWYYSVDTRNQLPVGLMIYIQNS